MHDLYRPRSKRGRRVRRKLPIARAYEETKKAAEEASGVWAAQRAYCEAKSALEQAMKAGQDLRPRTMAGVGAKARAMPAYATTVGGNGFSWVSMVYDNGLTADVVGLTPDSRSAWSLGRSEPSTDPGPAAPLWPGFSHSRMGHMRVALNPVLGPLDQMESRP